MNKAKDLIKPEQFLLKDLVSYFNQTAQMKNFKRNYLQFGIT